MLDEVTTQVEDTFNRLRSKPNVTAVLLLNHEGQHIMVSAKPGHNVDKYSSVISQLVNTIKLTLKPVDDTAIDGINFLRLRTAGKEFIVVPDSKFILAVVQTPAASSFSAAAAVEDAFATSPVSGAAATSSHTSEEKKSTAHPSQQPQ